MLIGIDEVGRGCLAGPLCVAAVSLLNPVEGLKDSKKLSPKRREELDKLIRDNASYIKIILISNDEIDSIGLAESLKKAFISSVDVVDKGTNIITDGNINYLKDLFPNSEAIIKADDSVPEVSAASIVAKVYRDKLMVEFDKDYPGYNFIVNKGYGTKEHLNAIKEIGVSKLHRKSFKPISSYS
jgi:ribonuclease HII